VTSRTDQSHGWRLAAAWVLMLAVSYAALVAVTALALGALVVGGSVGLLVLVVAVAAMGRGLR